MLLLVLDLFPLGVLGCCCWCPPRGVVGVGGNAAATAILEAANFRLASESDARSLVFVGVLVAVLVDGADNVAADAAAEAAATDLAPPPLLLQSMVVTTLAVFLFSALAASSLSPSVGRGLVVSHLVPLPMPTAVVVPTALPSCFLFWYRATILARMARSRSVNLVVMILSYQIILSFISLLLEVGRVSIQLNCNAVA